MHLFDCDKVALVVHVHDGFDVENRGDGRRRAADASAALEVNQIVHREPVHETLLVRFHPGGERVEIERLLLARRVVHGQAFAERGGDGVDYDDLALGIFGGELVCGDVRGLHRAGELARKTDVEDVLARLQDRFESLGKGIGVDLHGGHVDARAHVGKECLNRHARFAGHVEIFPALHGKTHG
ncbi:hypothetical protein SDC9_112286 [bioreactor metagenome]|uniref:Uncharacterized protein n=1 Tax=bioreactor metagenome TaxID=1076179 RepID=A0A645BIU8_9ZZZZ